MNIIKSFIIKEEEVTSNYTFRKGELFFVIEILSSSFVVQLLRVHDQEEVLIDTHILDTLVNKGSFIPIAFFNWI